MGLNSIFASGDVKLIHPKKSLLARWGRARGDQPCQAMLGRKTRVFEVRPAAPSLYFRRHPAGLAELVGEDAGRSVLAPAEGRDRIFQRFQLLGFRLADCAAEEFLLDTGQFSD
jgi:hypothetical protein